MKKRKALSLTLEQADAHQRKHGFAPLKKAFVEVADYAVTKGKLRGKLRQMNVTEREFSLLLDAQKLRREILDWRFEGVRLRWGDCMVYKPDFTVRAVRIRLIEVKGAHIRDRDIVRFKGCRAEWKDWFDFELHQKDERGQWTRLL